jgi:cytochrome P450
MDDRKQHDRLRNIWLGAFRHSAILALRPRVADIVERLTLPVIEQLRAGEAMDLSAAICRPLPTLVIAMMMGVPDEMLPDVVRWSDAIAGGATNYMSEAAAQEAVVKREAAKTALAEYLLAELAERRKHPGEDLISAMAVAEAARELPDAHLVQNLRQLLFAGNETTAKWLAQLFLTYGQHADLRREIAMDPKLVPAANNEILRWQGPVGTLARRVRGGPIEIAGVRLNDGDDVTCLLASANRDPGRFDNPDVLNIHRDPQPNLGFGIGFHSCLGSGLAKLEAELAINRFLDEVRDYEIAGPYRHSALPLRGPLPVTVAMA